VGSKWSLLIWNGYVPLGFIQQTYCILFSTNHKYANTHVYANVRFNQPNSEQPAGAKQAGCELFNARSLRSFFYRNNELPAGAKKASLELSPTLDRSEYIFKKKEGEEPNIQYTTTANRNAS
jgi:hypothetical protein